MKFVMIPEEFINLQSEILKHPELIERLGNHPNGEIEMKLAEVAAYCEIILDGYYTKEDMNGIAKACTNRLIEKRTGITIIQGKIQ